MNKLAQHCMLQKHIPYEVPTEIPFFATISHWNIKVFSWFAHTVTFWMPLIILSNGLGWLDLWHTGWFWVNSTTFRQGWENRGFPIFVQNRFHNVPLSRNNPGHVVHTHVPLFTKQYNLVPVKGRWCSVTGKVTVVGLTLHWPCITDSVVYPGW